MNRALVGRQGEELAAAFLRRQGMRVLERNYRSNLGEIDLVCRDRDTLVFVEVKARTSAEFADPLASVGPRKRGKLRRLAQQYLVDRRLESVPVRFDVLSIVLAGPEPSIEHLAGAF